MRILRKFISTSFVLLTILQSCGNLGIRDEKKEFIHSSVLDDKYYHEINMYLLKRQDNTCIGIQSYKGSLVFGRIFNKKYESFINRDVYTISQCVLCDNDLYIGISDGNTWGPKEIFLKISKNQYKIIVVMSNDYGEPLIFAPFESTLRISSNKFHIGDTIVGEISLTHIDSLFGYKCDGHFMGVIEQCTEEYEKKVLHLPSGKAVLELKGTR